MRSLSDKKKEMGQLGGEWGWGRKKRNEQESKTQMHSMEKHDQENFQKRSMFYTGRGWEGWKACSSGSLGVLWVSFSVSRCPSSVLTRFLAPIAGPCDSSCEDHQDTGVDFAGKLRKKQMPGMTVSYLPPAPWWITTLLWWRGLWNSRKLWARSGRAT